MKKYVVEKKEGITLISLVVTIIVLLILAGVSISMLTGDNGLITKAQEATKKYQEATENEQDILSSIDSYITDNEDEEDVETYSQQNTKVTSFLNDANSTYTDDNYDTVSVVENYASSSEIYDDPVGYTIDVTTAGTIYIEDETDGSINISDEVSVGDYTIYDLIPNHIYKWYIVANGTTTQEGRIKPTGQIRMIYDSETDSSDNIRDIGGWTSDGGTIKYGMIYRGENPALLASETKEKMQNIFNVSSEIDLCSEAETESLYSNIDYNQYVLTDSTWKKNLTLGSEYAENLANALTKIMENAVNGEVTYIHCWEGADRTGLVCWMLEGLLGVSNKDCSIDYELTSFSGRTARIRTGQSSTGISYLYSLGYNDTLREALLHWCENAGISIDLINNFRNAMSTGTPETLSYDNNQTNILAKATTSDLTTIFNEVGYQDGKYCSATDINTYSTDSSYFATGIMKFDTPISLTYGTGGGTIYIKGAEFTEESHCRLQLAWNGNTIYNAGQMSTLSGIEEYFTVTKISDKYYSLTPKISELASALSSYTEITGFRLSLPGSGADVTISYSEID